MLLNTKFPMETTDQHFCFADEIQSGSVLRSLYALVFLKLRSLLKVIFCKRANEEELLMLLLKHIPLITGGYSLTYSRPCLWFVLKISGAQDNDSVKF